MHSLFYQLTWDTDTYMNKILNSLYCFYWLLDTVSFQNNTSLCLFFLDS